MLDIYLSGEPNARYATPREGYQVEREDGGRVLLTYDVDGETKVAFVAAADVGNYAGDRGWHELTFLYLGGAERGAVFVRDRDREFESELMRTIYDGSSVVTKADPPSLPDNRQGVVHRALSVARCG